MRTHIYRTLVCLVLLLLASCNNQPVRNSKKAGPLTLTTTRMRKGQRVTFRYHQDESYLAGLPDLEGRLYYVVSTMPYASDLSMTDSGGVWSGSFTLPDSAMAYGLKFSSGDQIDDNKGGGYVFPVSGRSGKPIPGALTAESSFYSGLGQDYLGLKQNPDSAVALVQRDHAIHPGVKKTWPEMYFYSLIQIKRTSAFRSLIRKKKDSATGINTDSLIQIKLVPTYRKIRADIKQMLSPTEAGERDYMAAYFAYQQMEMEPQADSLGKVMMQKFPAGLYVQQKKFEAFDRMLERQNNIDSLGILYNRFKQEFPAGTNTSLMESNMLDRLALACAKASKFDKFNQYVSQITDKQGRAWTCNQAAWGLATKGKDLSFDSTISQRSLQLIKQVLDNPGQGKRPYYSERDWLRLVRSDYGNFSDTYAMIMLKKGDLKNAVAAQKTAVEYTDGNNPGINERYAEYLVKSGAIDTAMATIPEFIEKGKFTTRMTDYLKTAYIRQKGSDEGFTGYVDSLASIAGSKMKAKLEREMIDKPAPAFDLSDLTGKHVSLASLRGKIVVVDFWATWCGPCKASFPGMQKAVNGFKNDPNVVFLFVDTQEHTKPAARQKAVADFITKNKYTFHVLLDRKQLNDATRYQTVDAYGVTGIPTKFVIDPEGHIRFKSVGYYGSDAELVREVNTMITLVKQNETQG